MQTRSDSVTATAELNLKTLRCLFSSYSQQSQTLFAVRPYSGLQLQQDAMLTWLSCDVCFFRSRQLELEDKQGMLELELRKYMEMKGAHIQTFAVEMSYIYLDFSAVKESRFCLWKPPLQKVLRIENQPKTYIHFQCRKCLKAHCTACMRLHSQNEVNQVGIFQSYCLFSTKCSHCDSTDSCWFCVKL